MDHDFVVSEDSDSSRNESSQKSSTGGSTSRNERSQKSCSNVNSTENIGDGDMNEVGDEYDIHENINNSAGILEIRFKTVKEAEEFYISYGRELGFDVRKSTLKRKKGSDLILNREFLCSRQGFRSKKNSENDRKREAKSETRCGCNASFRVALVRTTGEYRVTRFQSEHNHPLENSDTSHRLRCNRYLTPSTKAMLDVMTNVGFRPCHILDYIENLGGGNGSGVINRKDGYNYLNKQRLGRIEGGDVNTLLGILEGMKIKDKSMIFKYTVDDKGALTRLFWCDGMSRAEYELFGDVVLFDSTYKTNMYRFPLVIFSGVNCHLVTCVFGAAILYSETIESYRWLLQTFRESMNGKAPVAILTDQDASMRAAVEHEFPDTIHRLCCWHISRNAEQHVKSGKFSTEFSELMKRACSIEELERRWRKLIDDYGVTNNNWVKEIYTKKEQWAEAFFRGHFFAMMRSTQRAESLNSSLKQRVKVGNSLTDFFRHYNDFFLKKIRQRFAKIQIESEQTPKELKVGLLRNLENHAARICTKAILRHLRDEIRMEADVVVQSMYKQKGNMYRFNFGDHTSEHIRSYIATIDLDESKFDCECLMLQSDGIPCRHLICAFKNMRISLFPDKSINNRWFVDTGRKLRIKFPFSKDETPESVRFAKITKECMNYANLSSKSKYLFDNAIKKVREMTTFAEDEINTQSKLDGNEPDQPPPKHFQKVADPEKIIPKGGTKGKKQLCGWCREEGHKATTCEEKKLHFARNAHVDEGTMPSTNSRWNNDDSRKDEFVGDNTHTQPLSSEPCPSMSSFHMDDNLNSHTNLLLNMMNRQFRNSNAELPPQVRFPVHPQGVPDCEDSYILGNSSSHGFHPPNWRISASRPPQPPN